MQHWQPHAPGWRGRICGSPDKGRIVGIDDSSAPEGIILTSDVTDYVDDLFDIETPLVGLIARTQAGLQELLQQCIHQQLPVTPGNMTDAFIRQPDIVLGCDFDQ